MVNSDTILPFPEMKGGRGMIGIPKAHHLGLGLHLPPHRHRHHTQLHQIEHRPSDPRRCGRTRSRPAPWASTSPAIKLLAFVVGSFVAGIGGGVYAHYIGFLAPATFDFIAGFNPLIIVVFGGLGSMTGTIAAVLRLDILPRRLPARPPGTDGHRCAVLALRPLSDSPAPPHAHPAAGPLGHGGVGFPQGRGGASNA